MLQYLKHAYIVTRQEDVKWPLSLHLILWIVCIMYDVIQFTWTWRSAPSLYIVYYGSIYLILFYFQAIWSSCWEHWIFTKLKGFPPNLIPKNNFTLVLHLTTSWWYLSQQISYWTTDTIFVVLVASKCQTKTLYKMIPISSTTIRFKFSRCRPMQL